LPRWISKALAVGPGMVVSTVLTWMVGALLPPLPGLALFVGGLMALALLLLGRGERVAARVLYRAHPLSEEEQAALAPALTLLCSGQLGPPLVQMWVCSSDRRAVAEAVGRRTVVVAVGVLDALQDGRLNPAQAAAVIGHAAALVRDGWVRHDLAIAYWSLPWLTLRAIAHGLSATVGRLPLIALAWRLRIVLVTIAVVQAVQQGWPWVAAMLGVLGAVSYAIPVWERRWDTLLLTAGDTALLAGGLASPWASVLRRHTMTPRIRRRLRTLEPLPTALASLALVTRD